MAERKDEPSVVALLQEYARAAWKIEDAAFEYGYGDLEQYQRDLEEVIDGAIATLVAADEKAAKKLVSEGEKEGKAEADAAKAKAKAAPGGEKKAAPAPKQDPLHPLRQQPMTRQEAADLLDARGFRYGTVLAQGERSFDAYIELREATERAGIDLVGRVNRIIEQLKGEGEDTVYNVQQAIKKDMAEHGVLAVEYARGRRVSLDSYARMAARSARMESKTVAALGRALENGTDYVQCTTIYPTCEICARYQGKIYCISGKDDRFPSLFDTALKDGYALMHPNCRHEFIPVWLDDFGDEDLQKQIKNSEIDEENDVRRAAEVNAYKAWQAEHRLAHAVAVEYSAAQKVLGADNPYSSKASFQTSYKATKGSYAWNKSHHLQSDYSQWNEMKAAGVEGLPKTFAEFQRTKYKKTTEWDALKAKAREKKNGSG